MVDLVVTTMGSAVLEVTLQKASSFVKEEFLAFYHVKEDIGKLENMFEELRTSLEDMEKNLSTSSNHNALNMWVGKLTIAAYDAQDLMDYWATEVHLWKMKNQVRKLFSPFTPTSYICQYGISRELREIVARLDKILEEVGKDVQGHRGISRRDEPLSSRQSGSLGTNLVVDDIWKASFPEWEKLENVFSLGPKGSPVMVTGRDSTVAGIRLEELKNMVYLTGTLHISKLENAATVGDANLKDKEWLQKVVYEWSNQNINTQDKAREEEVLEELQPHSNVREVHIFHYRGIELPTWMKNGQLQNLVAISLKHCARTKILNLGQLPKLKEVRLKNMQVLEEWQEEQQEEHYPSLKKLKISHCPKLTKLPCFFPKLDHLKIKKCDLLETIPLAPLTNITLVDNPLLKHLNEDLPVGIVYKQRPEETREVKISNCPELLKLPDFLYLDKLEIIGCRSLTASWEKENVEDLQHLAMDTYIDDKLLSLIHGNNTLHSGDFKHLQCKVSSQMAKHPKSQSSLYPWLGTS
ncbi:hypothetical protein FEM48_Zijuj01G0304100 [Ziziphus jujuba var. spinosa]|uniref:Rx N-terminal domain-containing protein n=1 Tax=Ziziphus jujuba var. spinosa TaxID=714518 RepID=A0A978W601_ZIZJJ|nr:hypothetical protein FEM48_Zijuj01G0304100 [Ziziphus jujuba var. spinosa]